MVITSVDNKEIKLISKLSQRKYRDLENKFIVEGYHLVEEAKKSGLLEKVIILEDINYDCEVASIVVSREVMKKISTMDSIPEVIGICHKMKEQPIKNKILALDGVQDPGNLGTIIRSSVAFGIDTIILSNDTVDLYNPKVIRATQGMIFYINIIRKDLNSFIPLLKKEGYTIYTTNVKNGSDVRNIKIPSKYVLILGNEGQGVKDNISSYADDYIYIQTSKKVESLNVGVAASIILYEMGNYNE